METGSAATVIRLPTHVVTSPEALLAALVRDPHTLAARTRRCRPTRCPTRTSSSRCTSVYELHYRGLPGVSDGWEWEPSLLALRRQLEARFEAGLIGALGAPEGEVAAEEMDVALRAVEAADEAPSLSRYIEREGTHAEMLEFLVHRSRLPAQGGRPALVGAAAPDRRAEGRDGRDPGRRVRRRQRRAHARALFAKSMDRLGLDATYGAYLDRIPGVTLATVNLMSLLGLHRRWRGALVGHLALFEMSSSVPNRRYGSGLRRLG